MCKAVLPATHPEQSTQRATHAPFTQQYSWCTQSSACTLCSALLTVGPVAPWVLPPCTQQHSQHTLRVRNTPCVPRTQRHSLYITYTAVLTVHPAHAHCTHSISLSAISSSGRSSSTPAPQIRSPGSRRSSPYLPREGACVCVCV